MSFPFRLNNLPPIPPRSSKLKRFALYDGAHPQNNTGVYRFFIPALALVFTVGLLAGWTLADYGRPNTVTLELIDDAQQAGAAVVHLEGIRNGVLQGTVEGDVRLVAGRDIVAVNASGAFAISNTNVLTNIIEITVPPGMRFVASSRGKKYYPVESAQAQNLTVANRVYFPNEAAAEKAGFVR